MPKKKARARDARIISSQKSRRLCIGVLVGLTLTLFYAGIMAPWKASVVSENPHALPAPDPSPTPLPLVKEYIYAGGKLIATEEPTPLAVMDDASFVTQQAPTSMIVGQSYNVSLTFQNTGSNHWDSVSYQLGSQNPQDNNTWGLSRVALPQATSSQAQVTVSFIVTAPSTPGAYSFQWKMIQNNSNWFGTASTNLSINVFAASLNSISVNGTTAYAAVPNSTSINIAGPITVEAWIRLNAITGNYQTIVARHSWGQVGTGGGYELTITNTGKPRLDLYQSHNQYTTLIGATTVTTGVWHHVAGVFDGSYMKIYLNGVLDGSQANGNGPASGTSVLNIGRNPYPSQYFGGLIDEVRVSAGAVYSSNFSPATSLSAAGSTRALWKFDNQTLADSSGNNNTCSLNGNASFSAVVP